ncbi:MAG TPA: ABC transporter substrate-binding protein [Ktedonobacterales bacterium]|jgi:multiple sugar transport system substrate-binding protein|nr:ABC transporter substrate-binding protein [Ktedonobacterales bacterium]
MNSERREAIDEMIVKMRAGRMSRRAFVERAAVLGLSASFVGTLLDACGSGGSGGPTVVAWESENEATGTYQDLVNKFNQSQKDVQVHWTNGPSDTGQLLTKFSTMLRARSNSIDIMSMDIIWPAQFGASGWTFPIDGKWPASERQNYLPGPVAGCTYNGKIWAAPFRTDAGLIYYRTDLVPTPPNTWDDLTNSAQQALSSGAVKYGYVWQGAQYEGLVCDFVEVVYGYGGSILDPNNPKTVTTTSPQTVQGLTQMVSWVGGISPQAVTTYKEEDARTTFQNGDAAFMRNWPYAYAHGQNASESKIVGKFDVHTMLYGGSNTTGHSSLGGWQLGINAFSSKTDAAWQFVHYMMQEPAQKEAAIKASLTVTLQSIYDDADVLKANPFFAKLKPVFQTAQPRPVTPKYPDVTLAIQQQVHNALLKQAAPADAMSALATQLQGIVS